MISSRYKKLRDDIYYDVRIEGNDNTILQEFEAIIICFVRRNGMPIETLIQCMEEAKDILDDLEKKENGE